MKKTLLKGLAVLLPAIILVTALLWVWSFLGKLIQPHATWISTQFNIPHIWAVIIIVLLFSLICYTLGWMVTTAICARVLHLLEVEVLYRAPGYALLRNIVGQLFGAEKSPFSSFAVVEFEHLKLRMTGFITEQSTDGWCTLFVPTGPNPTSGLSLHVQKTSVKELNVSASDAFESIIGCGSGSAEFHEKLKEASLGN